MSGRGQRRCGAPADHAHRAAAAHHQAAVGVDLARSPTARAGRAERLLLNAAGPRDGRARARGAWRATAPSRACRPDKRLAEFDFAAVPCVSKAHVMALAEGDELARAGAQPAAVRPARRRQDALGVRAGPCADRRGLTVLFTRTSELVQRLQAARRDLRLPAELAKLDRFDLLILDDLSYVRRDQAET